MWDCTQSENAHCRKVIDKSKIKYQLNQLFACPVQMNVVKKVKVENQILFEKSLE